MNLNVLLVDDEPNVPRAIRRALRHEPYAVSIANDASHALELLASKPIDIVISDHRMPGITGAELLKTVSERYPDTVRMMLSGQADFEAVIEAVNEGHIYKFLTKPWSNDTLRSILADAAEKAKAKRVDTTTGWLAAEPFIDQLQKTLDQQAVRLVAGEIRNLSTVWALVPEEDRLELANKVVGRCNAAAGDIEVPFGMLERGLFAFGIAPDETAVKIDGISERLNAPMNVHDQGVALNVVLGYADGAAGGNAQALIRQALTAVSEAHSTNKKYVEYSARSSATLHQRHSLESDLTSAMANQQFFLMLQPQVDAARRRIRGAESLIRWQHPVHGLVSPLQFIDMAERNGLINDIGVWVICQAMENLRALAAQGTDNVRISVNVSPRQFCDGETSAWVMALEDYARDDRHLLENLELEITESTVMNDTEVARELLEHFKDIGLRVALDDFGTGHSSLSQVNELPLDVLKLDRSLISHVETDRKSRTLLTYLVQMAKDLDLEVIAEGVESEWQVSFCRDLGCDLIQGYAFYKPLRIEEFMRALAEQ